MDCGQNIIKIKISDARDYRPSAPSADDERLRLTGRRSDFVVNLVCVHTSALTFRACKWMLLLCHCSSLLGSASAVLLACLARLFAASHIDFDSVIRGSTVNTLACQRATTHRTTRASRCGALRSQTRTTRQWRFIASARLTRHWHSIFSQRSSCLKSPNQNIWWAFLMKRSPEYFPAHSFLNTVLSGITQ